MRAPIIIILRPAPRTPDSTLLLFDAYVGARKLCRSATPFFAGARVLLAEGESPNTILLCRHDGSDTIGLRSTVAGAARLRVKESAGEAPRFREFEKFDPDGTVATARTKP